MSNSMNAALVAAAKKDKNFAALLMKAIAEKPKAKAKSKAKPKAKTQKSEADLELRRAVFAIKAVEAAKKAGYADAVANENIFTWGKWQERGFTVKKGEKAFRVKTQPGRGSGLPLFHASQVEPSGALPTAQDVAEQVSA